MRSFHIFCDCGIADYNRLATEERLDRLKKNINAPLVIREIFILLPLHIRFGLMKRYVKLIDEDSTCVSYILVSKKLQV